MAAFYQHSMETGQLELVGYFETDDELRLLLEKVKERNWFSAAALGGAAVGYPNTENA